MIDLIETRRPAIPSTTEPGWSELCAVLEDVLPSTAADDGAIELEQLKTRVYRLRIGSNGTARSFVLKRYDPWLARRNELVVQCWLPALGLADRSPRLLATAAERRGRWVWHAYEDLGNGALDPTHTDPGRVEAVVDLLAELHTGAIGHAIVPQCRHYCGNLGAPFFVANVRDAIALLESLAPPHLEPTPDQGELRGRLLGRLYRLRDEMPQRVQMLETLGGPDTLLHGDLWTTNALVADTPDGPTARLIDWDHVAVGPVSYDLSTFLYRFAKADRPWILDAYRRAVGRAGWHLPAAQDLNALFETAEYARYANRIIWPAVALLEERAAWGFEQLAEVERWFDALNPALPD
ncbi:MAG TPA: aminoglycoside phosphotransferase family protein [Gemmatimonadales bacterium]|nr:aminoglycoside phosphotransferase family protein [Gemmatimonadales bacterium]